MGYGLNDLRLKYTTKNKGMSETVPGGLTTSISHKVVYTDNKTTYLKSVRFILINQHEDDLIKLSIVDKDYTYAGILYPSDYGGLSWSIAQPNGVELDWFGDTWNVISDKSDQGKEDPGYWSQIPNNTYIVINYKSVGILDVKVKVNIELQQDK